MTTVSKVICIPQNTFQVEQTLYKHQVFSMLQTKKISAFLLNLLMMVGMERCQHPESEIIKPIFN